MGDVEEQAKDNADRLKRRLEAIRDRELDSNEKRELKRLSQEPEGGPEEPEADESLYSSLEKKAAPADEFRAEIESSGPEVEFEPFKPEEGKNASSRGAILLVAFIFLVFSLYIYATVFRSVPDDQTNVISVNGQEIAFRSLISDCKAVPVLPNASSVMDSVRKADKVILLFDPNKDARYALGVSEIYKVLSFLNIQSSYAYLAPCNVTVQTDISSCVPGVPLMSVSDGTPSVLAVSLEQLNATFVSSIAPGQIIVSGADAKGYDSAVCAFDLSVLGVV